MLIEKQIPLSDFEREMFAKQDGFSFLLHLPLPILRWAVLRNLEGYRYPKDLIMPLTPDCTNEIKRECHEVEGTPNTVGISVFTRASEDTGKKPLLFFIHGGGFLGGSSIMNENLMRLVADNTGAVAATVDYNVAPEVQYPVPLEDCLRALMYVLEHFPIDKTRIFIAGDSAGGNLTAALTLKMLDEGILTPCGQIMLYPVCDLAELGSESHRKKGKAYAGMCKGIKLARGLYLPDKASRRSPYVSPLFAVFNKPQPDALVLVAECDGLCDDGINYGKKLDNAGGYARTVLYKGAYHSFINDLHRSGIADDAAAEILEFLEARIGTENAESAAECQAEGGRV